MAIMAISVAPAGIEGSSMSDYVSKAIQVLKDDGRVTWELGPMFTSVEGELHVLFDIAEKMHEAIAGSGAPRIGTVIKIDDRRDHELHMKNKVDAVNRKLTNPS